MQGKFNKAILSCQPHTTYLIKTNLDLSDLFEFGTAKYKLWLKKDSLLSPKLSFRFEIQNLVIPYERHD